MNLRPRGRASHRAHITVSMAYFGGNHHAAVLDDVVHTIQSVNPSANPVVISRRVKPMDIRGASFRLMETLRICQDGIHLGLVYPTVDTLESRSIVIECRRGVLVGPDNGILMPAVRELGLEAAYEVSDPRFWPSPPSRTSGAIEACASLAAYISLGMLPREAGPRLENLVEVGGGSSSASPVPIKLPI